MRAKKKKDKEKRANRKHGKETLWIVGYEKNTQMNESRERSVWM